MKTKRGKEIFVELVRPGISPKTVPARRGLTMGTDYGADITIAHPSLPPSFRFLRNKGLWGHTLRLPKSAKGFLKRGGGSFPIENLVKMELLKKSGGFYLLELDPGNSGEVQIGSASIRFGYRERPPSPPRLPFIPFISGGEYVFLFLLLVSAAIHAAGVNYLNSLEIKKRTHIEAIKEMEPRFAKLILTPREVMKEEKSALRVRKEVEVEEKKVEEKAEKAPPEKKPSHEKTEKIERVEPPAAEKAAAEDKAVPRGEKIAEKVRTKGLLGVISAKGGIMADLPTDDVLTDVDYIIGTAKKTGREDGGELEGLGVMEVVNVPDNIVLSGPGLPGPRGEEEIVKEKKGLPALGKKEKKVEEHPSKREEAGVYKVVKSYVGGLKYLYNKALRKDPTLKGTITAKLVIAAAGSVARVEMLDSTLEYPPLERAIIKRIGLWKFKEVGGVEDFTITYTFDFAPVG